MSGYANLSDNNGIVETIIVCVNFHRGKNKIEKEYEENKTKDPEIGMTASEVRKSTWGEPDKINKDTYSWGTNEQWVYNSKGDIYFENGVVTSMSER